MKNEKRKKEVQVNTPLTVATKQLYFAFPISMTKTMPFPCTVYLMSSGLGLPQHPLAVGKIQKYIIIIFF